MNIAVLVKLVPDTQAVLKIGEDHRHIATADLNFVLNPYDEYAVEEALQIREREGGKVTVFSLGGDEAVKALRNAIAMGADEGVHLRSPVGLDVPGTSKALAHTLKDGNWDLILTGKQAVDNDCAAVGPMVAELLGIPHVSKVTKLEISGGKATAHREIESGIEVFEVDLPVLITAEKGLNEPRYASLKGIMMAKRKQIETVEVEQTPAKVEILKLEYPPARPPGRIVGEGVEAVPELVRLLKEEAKVI